jgi:hypothetical protein
MDGGMGEGVEQLPDIARPGIGLHGLSGPLAEIQAGIADPGQDVVEMGMMSSTRSRNGEG